MSLCLTLKEDEFQIAVIRLLKGYGKVLQFADLIETENQYFASGQDEIIEAILDLIGIPEDETVLKRENGFCRDWFYDVISDRELSSEEKLKRLIKGKYNV